MIPLRNSHLFFYILGADKCPSSLAEFPGDAFERSSSPLQQGDLSAISNAEPNNNMSIVLEFISSPESAAEERGEPAEEFEPTSFFVLPPAADSDIRVVRNGDGIRPMDIVNYCELCHLMSDYFCQRNYTKCFVILGSTVIGLGGTLLFFFLYIEANTSR